MYFLFLATLYILDIILNMAPVPPAAQDAATFLETFIDSVTSVLICRFMLLLRQFDTNTAVATCSGFGPQVEEYMASTMFKFSAQHSYSLPAFISSFAHPVHAGELQFENTDVIGEDEYE
ncbi:hypothetical protein GSI_04966 [Ganoderma sinense ZZ0214-1]|uniref:Transporter n=1 Tax=Ganoderma sinense ZZ0214-1 TaxID=1077348 RepID=A0A2G8SGF4_9APHY|nr:hypothetical protein GSI_04966 [Ganoderma sinense ZZ0214-1]